MRFLISEKLGPHKYKTPEGYLVCVDAILSRIGTQEYRRCELFGDACDDPDKTITVDRKADEVFSDKAMASFENKAICIEHPNTNVDVENHNDLSVGFVRDIHRGEDNDTPVMMGTLVITDKDAVEAVESGEYKELSCGYDCDIEDEHSPQQRNIRGNHVALCKQGRAGIARIVDSKTTDTLDKNIRFQARNIAEWMAHGNGSNASDNEIDEFFKDYRITLSETQLHEAITYIRQMIRAYNNEHKMGEDFWDWMNAKGKRFKDAVDSNVNDDVTITNSKIWNPDFYLKKEPNYEKAYNDIRIMMKNAKVIPYDIEISVYGSHIKFNPSDVKFDAHQLKQILTQVLQQINRSLSVSSIRSRGGTVTFEIAGYQYLQEKYKVFKSTKDAYTDFEYGYRDGKLGTYDKWYRYNRKDEGKEYDMGIQKAKREGYEIKNFIKGTGDSMKDKRLTNMDYRDSALRDEISYYGNSWDRLVKKIVPKDKIISIGTNLGRGRTAIVEGKEYAEALKKATLSEGKVHVYTKPYGSYPNYFEVSFSDSTDALTNDAYMEVATTTPDDDIYYAKKHMLTGKVVGHSGQDTLIRFEGTRENLKNFKNAGFFMYDPDAIIKDAIIKDASFRDELTEDASSIQISKSSKEFERVIRAYYKNFGKIIQVETMVYDFETGKYYMCNESTDYSFTSKRLSDSITKDETMKDAIYTIQGLRGEYLSVGGKSWVNRDSSMIWAFKDINKAFEAVKKYAPKHGTVMQVAIPSYYSGMKFDSQMKDDNTSRQLALALVDTYGKALTMSLVEKLIKKEAVSEVVHYLHQMGVNLRDSLKKFEVSYKDSNGNTRIEIVRAKSLSDAIIKDSLKDSVYTVEYVKDNVTHIVEVEAKTIADAVIKAKNFI